jgi:hypothetical protein
VNSSRPLSNRSERYSLSCVYDKKTAYIILVFVAGLSLVNDKICATISVRDRYFFKSRVKSTVSTYKNDHSLLCHLRYLIVKKGTASRGLFLLSLGLARVNHDFAQPLSYSSWRRHQTPVSLRPLGARSSH